MTHQEDAINDVLLERDRQDEQWGVQNHHPAYWLAILGKQVGQLGSAVLDREWWVEKEKATAKVREEAVQVAAVAVALIECIDKGEMPVGLVTAKPEDPRQLAKALGRGDEAMPYDKDEDVQVTVVTKRCYHCELEIAEVMPGVYRHVNQKAFLAWIDERPTNTTHPGRWEPPCEQCGRDNANGTHDALQSTGHLNHAYKAVK